MREQNETLPVYIGHDPREQSAYDVCKHSMVRHSSLPLCVIPMYQKMLRYIGLYDRDFEMRDGQGFDKIDGKPFSTEFSFTRFLVPAMTQYKGWALFCDCDMLFRADLRELIEQCDEKYAVMVVKHDYHPKEQKKMDDQLQEQYHRKNWSSVILWNCEHPSNLALTVNEVNTRPGAWLHAFSWLKDEEIGELDEKWNWLEGWSDNRVIPANVHFTRGVPDMPGYENVPYAEEYRREQALIENESETNQRRNVLEFTGGR